MLGFIVIVSVLVIRVGGDVKYDLNGEQRSMLYIDISTLSKAVIESGVLLLNGNNFAESLFMCFSSKLCGNGDVAGTDLSRP